MTVDAHDPRWTAIGERWTGLVADALGRLDPPEGTGPLVVEHIGSTAVPGLAAKPIIDLQVRLAALPTEEALEAELAPLGFSIERGARPDSPGVYRDNPRPGADPDPALYRKRLLTRTDVEGEPPVILHVRRLDSPFAAYVVAFRDWLRAVPAEAAAYEATKRSLAARHSDADDYDDYTRDKTAFLDAAQARMEHWLAERDRSERGPR
ncbi:GrpB family protein [Cellulosimicrobium protaetiae]|uniref:GrpB family protein n=1 Tax=Cellulosimicrobium protaetiae TaxID=2587808 RepID=A0A6M5UJW6_9MICO|nr:GrpB family protein [Cellulosimicrobium protaetiae]